MLFVGLYFSVFYNICITSMSRMYIKSLLHLSMNNGYVVTDFVWSCFGVCYILCLIYVRSNHINYAWNLCTILSAICWSYSACVLFFYKLFYLCCIRCLVSMVLLKRDHKMHNGRMRMRWFLSSCVMTSILRVSYLVRHFRSSNGLTSTLS